MIDLNLLTVCNDTTNRTEEKNEDRNGESPVVCPISTATPSGGYWVSMIVDSGAGESVSPIDAFGEYPFFETNALFFKFAPFLISRNFQLGLARTSQPF